MTEHKQQTLCRRIAVAHGLLNQEGFPAFADLMVPDELTAPFGGVESARNNPNFTALAHAVYAAMIVCKAGDPVFELSPDIVRALRDTEVPDVPSEDIKLPFVGINVDFPMGTLAPPAQHISRFLVLHAPGDRFRVVMHQLDRTSYLNMQIDAGRTLYECVGHAMKNQWKGMHDPETIQRFRDENLYDNYWESDIFRLALNTVLYITSPDADLVQDKTREHALHTKLQGMKGGRKRDAVLSKLAQAKQTKRYIVGAKFRLSQEYQADLTDTGRKWVLDHRVRVMGHFKMQPCGPGLTERKRIWVAPYMKGMNFAEMVQKGYVVK